MNGGNGLWSTAQLARMSGVTSRTLRHYDEIGLLRPASVAASGMRRYERDQVLRLQQILVLRELGLGLASISTIINDGGDRVEQLRRHYRWLIEERDRFARLAETVAATLTELGGGRQVELDQLFDGFDAAEQERYETELVTRYGDQIVTKIDESRQAMSGWTASDAGRIQAEWASFGTRLVALIEAGAAVDDGQVQAIIAEHHQWLTNFWTPDRESYTGLGQLYADNPDFRAQFDAEHPRLAEFLRDAMASYAQQRL